MPGNHAGGLLHLRNAAQLLVCDWLLETRTAVWEEEGMENDGASPAPVSNAVLTGFQRNLSSLRRLTQHIPVRIL